MRTDLLTEYNEAAAAAARPIYAISDKGSEDALKAAPQSLAALAKANGFGGEAGAVLANSDGVLLGVGDGRDPFFTAAAAEKLPQGDYHLTESLGHQEAAQAALGWLLGTYRFDRYKKQKAPVARLIAPKGVRVDEVSRQARATALVRDLVNTPAQDMTPAAIEEAARELGARHDAKVTSIVGDDLLELNFPMIHAVGRAAAAAPRLIDLTWGRANAPKVTLVGKGVSFDSGGLDIKNASGMLIMKKDMGGAANALGLAQMIMEAGLDLRLRVLIPAVENAISGTAFRPGDILKSRKGLTVEVGNTDAEGRLILADAIALGAEESPDLLVTLATLTGAARVALGPDLPAFYCDDEIFAGEVTTAAMREADPLWRMPLWRPYDSMLSSSIADMNNVSQGAFAGSVTAALFLKRFAPERWAHIDLFAWRPKAAPGRPLGGEAQTIRALYAVFAERYRR